MPIRALRTIDLFAGAGGMTQGLRTVASSDSAAFRPVGAVELDPHAAATYAANHGDHVYLGDIRRWLEGEQPAADVVVGGPPCQGFSLLGKRDEKDPRNQLWDAYVDTVTAVRPLAFVLENVESFLKSSQLQDLVAETSRSGRLNEYVVEPMLVDASLHGAAQKRRRAVLVGRHVDLAPFTALSGDPDRARTVRDAIGRLPHDVTLRELPDRTVIFRGLEMPGYFRGVDLHITRKYTELSLMRFGYVPAGGSRLDLPDELLPNCWRNHRSGSGDVMGRLRWERPSVTIRTEFFKPEKGRYLHPSAHRAITHREAARLQGFPDSYRWVGTKVSIARQIGNAVPVELGAAIGRHLADNIAAQSQYS